MDRHHFISYSHDGQDFAIRLYDTLAAGPPSYPVWLDKRDIRPGDNWGKRIAEAISLAKSLLFVMTRDSVNSQSICEQEWMRALGTRSRSFLCLSIETRKDHFCWKAGSTSILPVYPNRL